MWLLISFSSARCAPQPLPCSGVRLDRAHAYNTDSRKKAAENIYIYSPLYAGKATDIDEPSCRSSANKNIRNQYEQQQQIMCETNIYLLLLLPSSVHLLCTSLQATLSIVFRKNHTLECGKQKQQEKKWGGGGQCTRPYSTVYTRANTSIQYSIQSSTCCVKKIAVPCR